MCFKTQGQNQLILSEFFDVIGWRLFVRLPQDYMENSYIIKYTCHTKISYFPQSWRLLCFGDFTLFATFLHRSSHERPHMLNTNLVLQASKSQVSQETTRNRQTAQCRPKTWLSSLRRCSVGDKSVFIKMLSLKRLKWPLKVTQAHWQ